MSDSEYQLLKDSNEAAVDLPRSLTSSSSSAESDTGNSPASILKKTGTSSNGLAEGPVSGNLKANNSPKVTFSGDFEAGE